MNTIATDKKVVIVGLGKTGLSCVRYLNKSGRKILVMDSRKNPPALIEFRNEFPNIECILGRFDRKLLCEADEIILSPGVALSNEDIQSAINDGITVRGDIDLFAEAANAPIAAITGSNGKSTVTTLLGGMAIKAGLNVGIGGNLGTPALDLLEEGRQLYVLELSSFQLETTDKLNAACAVLLNISEDHMDRYPEKMAYLQAKQRIFRGAKCVVVNDDETLSQPLVSTSMKLIHFGLESTDINKFSVIENQGERFLVNGFDVLINVKEIKLAGEHNLSNALAALALASGLNISTDAQLKALREFDGLTHRCQYLRTVNGVMYINDSKGTNPGAVATAINSFGQHADGKIILIAGGESKGADLSPLSKPMADYGKSAILMGKDAHLLHDALSSVVKTSYVISIEEAVQQAHLQARYGDIVLLSPACASFDMFKNYEQRGDLFSREVALL